MKNFENDITFIGKHLQAKQESFDKVISLSREVVRGSALTITLLHNNKKKEAASMLSEVKRKVTTLKKIDRGLEPQSLQAYQEYAEASILYSIKGSGEIPACESLGIPVEGYLLGCMDVVGELKREILELLREDHIAQAETYFSMMKNIYDSTREFRFAEAVIRGFRRKQDTARIQLETAGSEILHAKRS
jgi:translin